MTTPATPEPVDPQSFQLFRRLVPAHLLDDFEVGHKGIFSHWIVVWLMIFQRLSRNASLSRAVAELKGEAVAGVLPDCKRVREGSVSMNTGAFSQARSNLPLEAAERVADQVFETLASTQRSIWKERRAFALDGTTLSLTHHPELLDRFPPALNQHGGSHWPVLQLVTVHDLASGFAARPEWGAMYGPEAVSETKLSLRLMKRLPSPSVLVADINFGIFAVAWTASQLGHDVVVRLKDDRWNRMVRQAKPAGPGEWRLEWRPSRWDLRGNPDLPNDAVVRGRLIELQVERDGERIVLRLFTTEETGTRDEFGLLYGCRWNIESDIKDLKQTMELDRPSGRSMDMVAKEILLGIVAYNLVIQVRRMAAERAGLEPRRLSFKRILDLVQAYGLNLAATADVADWDRRFDEILTAAAQCKLPVRKKRRSYPREVIARGRGFPIRHREK